MKKDSSVDNNPYFFSPRTLKLIAVFIVSLTLSLMVPNIVLWKTSFGTGAGEAQDASCVNLGGTCNTVDNACNGGAYFQDYCGGAADRQCCFTGYGNINNKDSCISGGFKWCDYSSNFPQG